MDFTPPHENELLRETLRTYVSRHEVALEDAVPGREESGVWDQLVALGVVDIALPVVQGGSEAGLLCEVVVAEEMARALLNHGWLSTVALALPALIGQADGELLAALGDGRIRVTGAGTWRADPIGAGRFEAEGVADHWVVSGAMASVPDLDVADYAVVPAATRSGPAMFLVSVRSPSVAVHRFQSLDLTRSLHGLQLEATPARLLVSPDEFTGVHRALQARALTLIAAEAVGLQQQLLLLSARYASERHQFGRAIGSFQGVSHPLADVYVNLELSRSLATWAAALHDNGSPESLAAAAAAAAKSLPCAVTAAEVAMQVHGAIGVTWESPLHRYYRRAVSNELLFGPVKELRRLVQDEAVSALVVG